MRVASSDLRLSRLIVIHAGSERYPLGSRVEAIPLKDVPAALSAGVT